MSVFAVTEVISQIDSVKITWNAIVNKNYTIFWRDNSSVFTWNEVDYPGVADDIADNGNGTKSWVDYGEDMEMNNLSPISVNKRFYKVVAN